MTLRNKQSMLVLMSLLVLASLIVGCGQESGSTTVSTSEAEGSSTTEAEGSSTTEAEEVSSEASDTYLSIAGGSQGGTSYIIGGGMASLIDKYLDNVFVTTEATTGAVENARLVASDDAQMGFILADTAMLAAK